LAGDWGERERQALSALFPFYHPGGYNIAGTQYARGRGKDEERETKSATARRLRACYRRRFPFPKLDQRVRFHPPGTK
jgi:hypothetical protein